VAAVVEAAAGAAVEGVVAREQEAVVHEAAALHEVAVGPREAAGRHAVLRARRPCLDHRIPRLGARAEALAIALEATGRLTCRHRAGLAAALEIVLELETVPARETSRIGPALAIGPALDKEWRTVQAPDKAWEIVPALGRAGSPDRDLGPEPAGVRHAAIFPTFSICRTLAAEMSAVAAGYQAG
jgi:hypothetical protein